MICAHSLPTNNWVLRTKTGGFSILSALQLHALIHTIEILMFGEADENQSCFD